MWLLWLVELDVPLGFLTCSIVPPRLVLKVLVRLALCQTNVTLYCTYFSLIPRWSRCLHSVAFDELAKAHPQIISSSCRRRTLCP